MSGNPCRVEVELRRECSAIDVVKPGTVLVMLHVNDGIRSRGYPMGEYDTADSAGRAATFLLDAVNLAYIAGMRDGYDRAIAAFDRASEGDSRG